MKSILIERYQTTKDLLTDITSDIDEVAQKIDEYSGLIGEKMRTTLETSKEDSEFVKLKEKIEHDKDAKRKKRISKKDKNSQWFDLDGIYIYNKIGINGELELYFKAIKVLKSKLEYLQKAKDAVDSMIKKGMDQSLGCIALKGVDSPYEVAFVKSSIKKKEFSYSSILKTYCEPASLRQAMIASGSTTRGDYSA